MLKNTIFILLMMTGIQSYAQTSKRYLKDQLELSTVDFDTFNAADFYSQAGNVVYKQSISGLTDPAVFGYVYSTQTVGQADIAGAFNGAKYCALSMVVNKDGKLIGICAEAAPARIGEIDKRLKVIESKYGKASALPKQGYAFTESEKYLQLSLVQAMDDYNKPIPDTFTTYLYMVDKAYLERIKEGLNGNEFKPLSGM
nr:hypothetical protein [Mucilaginibacter sp. L294]